MVGFAIIMTMMFILSVNVFAISINTRQQSFTQNSNGTTMAVDLSIAHVRDYCAVDFTVTYGSGTGVTFEKNSALNVRTYTNHINERYHIGYANQSGNFLPKSSKIATINIVRTATTADTIRVEVNNLAYLDSSVSSKSINENIQINGENPYIVISIPTITTQPTQPPSGGGGSSGGGGGGWISGGTGANISTNTDGSTETPAIITIRSDGAKLKFINGYPDKSFQPDNTISRAESAAMLSRIIEITGAGSPIGFNDVEAGFWGKADIDRLSSAKIVSGYWNNTFQPEQPITRAEFAQIINNALKFESGADTGLTDIDEHWGKPAISALAQKGYISGYPDRTFRPDASITRAEATTILTRLLGITPAPDAIQYFTDLTSEHWAYQYIMAAVNTDGQ